MGRRWVGGTGTKSEGERKTGHEKTEATAHHIQERSNEANDNKRSITYEKKPAAREKGPLSLLGRRRGRARTHARLPSRSDISVWWTVGQLVVLRQESVARESLRIVRGMFHRNIGLSGQRGKWPDSASGSSVSVRSYISGIVSKSAVEEDKEMEETTGPRGSEEVDAAGDAGGGKTALRRSVSTSLYSQVIGPVVIILVGMSNACGCVF